MYPRIYSFPFLSGSYYLSFSEEDDDDDGFLDEEKRKEKNRQTADCRQSTVDFAREENLSLSTDGLSFFSFDWLSGVIAGIMVTLKRKREEASSNIPFQHLEGEGV